MAPVTPQGHCRVIASCLVLEGLAGCELERKMQVPSEAWEEVLGALMGGHFVCKGFLRYREWANRHLPMCYVLGVGKIPWRREWQPTSVCLPRKCHGQRSLVGYNPWDHKESDMSEHTHAHARAHTHTYTYTHTHTHTSWGLFFPLFFFFLLQHKFIKCMLFLESANLVSQIVDWRKADYCGRLTSLLLPLCPLAT